MIPKNNPASNLPSRWFFTKAGAVVDNNFLTDAGCQTALCDATREIYIGTQGDLVVTRLDGTDVPLKNVVGRQPVVCTGVKATGSTAQDVTYYF